MDTVRKSIGFMTGLNTIFVTEREGATLIVTPQGGDAGFRYDKIHLEANAVLRVLDQPEVQNLIINLSQIDYANSIIIGAFIRMARKVTDRGGQSCLCCATKETEEVLTTMNLFQLWPHFATRDEALQSFES